MRPLNRRTTASPRRPRTAGPGTSSVGDPWQRWAVIGGLLSVLLVAVGLYQSNRSTSEQLRLTRQVNQALQTATRQQIAEARRDQMAKRFTDAIGQLGQEDDNVTDRLSMRVGAVHSLGLLMRDSPEDATVITEILRVFANERALDGCQASQRPDVVAAVKVLSRRPAQVGDRLGTLRVMYLPMHELGPGAWLSPRVRKPDEHQFRHPEIVTGSHVREFRHHRLVRFGPAPLVAAWQARVP